MEKKADFNDYRRLFLREFTRSIITEYLKANPIKMEIIKSKSPFPSAIRLPPKPIFKKESFETTSVSISQKSTLNPSVTEIDIPIKKKLMPPPSNQIRRPFLMNPQRTASQPSPRVPYSQPKEKSIILTIGERNESSELLKLKPFLMDPAVQSVECPGPGKTLLVDRSGIIQTTNKIMSKDEINSLMEEVSKITKIPLMQGLFKAALDNYLISAVVSEFVGTKFILQKKNPSISY